MYKVVQIDDMPKEVMNHTLDGQCSRCGSCCGRFIPVTKAELREIQHYVQHYSILPRKVVYPFAVKADIDGSCPFRDEREQCCTIYEVRPAICRIFQCNRWPTAKEALQIRGAEVVDLLCEVYGVKDPLSGVAIAETIRQAVTNRAKNNTIKPEV